MHIEFQHVLEQAQRNGLAFNDVMTLIRRHYECIPGPFTTGRGSSRVVENPAGANAASCCLLAFARRLGLDRETTLALYGEHYRDALAHPEGSSHANIRAFMANGWAGVDLPEGVLRLRGPA